VEVLEDRQMLSVAVNVDAAAGRHAINPNIYGVSYGPTSTLADLRLTLNRLGGNPTSRYNWQLNADNRAADWFFESIGYDSTAPGQMPDGFIADSRAGGAQPVITVPTLGWVAKLGANRAKLASFLVSKYGPQQETDFWFPDAGNGVRLDGTDVTGNDPNDANVASDVAFQRAWVQHLVSAWGGAAAGGVRYYTLDNEPSIWHATHRDVHPVGMTTQEVLDKTLAYSAMIKDVDPAARVIGPEEWGWSGYLLSGYDQQAGSRNGWSYFPDREAHGGMDYLPWLLDQLRRNEQTTGRRLVDVFSVHYYPQGGEFSDDVSRATQLRRNRSTRSLWDPTYVDESWIADTVKLVPRLHDWVNTYYPGTQTGLTEYSWGAEGHMNGATAEADILGILGREGLDLANRWVAPKGGTPVYNAFKLYRNYDGAGGAFGETSVAATTPDPDQVSAFAALRADGALTVMVVNKTLYDPANPGATTSITVGLNNFQHGGLAQAWQLYAPNLNDLTASAIRRLSDVSFAGSGFTLSVPMQSVTLFVVKPGTGPTPPAISVNDVSVREGNSGTKYATFTVRLDKTSTQTVTVRYTTADGTATAGSDYTAKTGTLTFRPGQTSKTVSVAVRGDTAVEAFETFTLRLSDPTNATLADDTGLGEIRNDDTRITIDDPTVVEGSGGTVDLFFTVRLEAVSTLTVTVKYTTASGTARGGEDYYATSGTLTFNPGETVKTVRVRVIGDSRREGLEYFSLNLSSAVNALFSKKQGKGTILDDD
jgi:hypothetical protein